MSFLESGQGPVVLLLHGIPGDAEMWRPVALRLAERFRVLAVDLRGFGQSDPPEGDDGMAAQAGAVGGMLAALEVHEFFAVAHDFGGPVAITLARQGGAWRMRGLALASTNVFTDPFVPFPLQLAGVPVLGPLLFRTMAGNRLGLFGMYAGAVARKADYRWADFRRALSPSAMEHTWRIFHRSLADLAGQYRAVEEHLPLLPRPALVIWGESDPFFPLAAGGRTHRALPGSVFRSYRGCGHFPAQECADRFAADVLSHFEACASARPA